MAAIETHPSKADVVLFKPIPRPEWRIPPPFKGPHSLDTKLKISRANKGRVLSQTARDNISRGMTALWGTNYKERRTGVKLSKQHRENIRKALANKYQEDPQYRTMKDKARQLADTPETRRKISIKLKGRKLSKETRDNIKTARKKFLRKKRLSMQKGSRIDNTSLELWKGAEENGLLPKMVQRGIIKGWEMDILVDCFVNGKGCPSDSLLDRFSLAVANLA